MIPRMAYMAKRPDIYSEEQRYKYAQLVVQRMKRAGLIITKGYGYENLPEEGGYIMFPNHQGKYDALGIIHTHTRPCSIIIDDAKSYTILTKQFIDILQGKRLIKDNLKQNVKLIQEMSDEAKVGRRFIIFPEGGYEKNQRNVVGQFKPGAFKSAMKAKVPIVPVALIDSWKVFGKISFLPVVTQVHYLEPIPYEEYEGLTTVEVSKLVSDKIKAKIDEVIHES